MVAVLFVLRKLLGCKEKGLREFRDLGKEMFPGFGSQGTFSKKVYFTGTFAQGEMPNRKDLEKAGVTIFPVCGLRRKKVQL